MKLILLCTLIFFIYCRDYPLYKQCAQPWRDQQLGFGDGTICNYGCLMTSVTMALGGIGYDFTPSTMNQWLKGHNGYYDGDGYLWNSVNILGMQFRGKFGNNRIVQFLDAGYVVICWVRGGTHWVLATGHSGSTIFVNDSGFPNNSYDISTIIDGQNGVYSVPGMIQTQEMIKSFQQNHQVNPKNLRSLPKMFSSQWTKQGDKISIKHEN